LGSMIPLIFSGIEPVFIAMSSGILMFVALVQLLPTALRLKFAPLWIALGSVMFFGSHYLLKLIGVNL